MGQTPDDRSHKQKQRKVRKERSEIRERLARIPLPVPPTMPPPIPPLPPHHMPNTPLPSSGDYNIVRGITDDWMEDMQQEGNAPIAVKAYWKQYDWMFDMNCEQT